MKLSPDLEQINSVLPQTQCGLCDYKGCRPYAEAIVNGEAAINRCPPGGVRGLLKLAEITGQDAHPYIAEMREKEKPVMLASIREDECIGCTKCISACPVDAIIGDSKQMHTVLKSECTGCELCVSPCPVDCIDMIVVAQTNEINHEQAEKKSKYYRMRYENRNKRLAKESEKLHYKHQRAKAAYKKLASKQDDISARKAAVMAAVQRHKTKNTDGQTTK
ncbi:MAG: RnfABCDGE type electron transport complex subunit B [Pseudomonadota bacterium]